VDALGNNAFKAEAAGVLEYGRTVMLQMLAECDGEPPPN
jgi:hypothetical protein